MNPMAKAWKKGSRELGFVFISPFSFTGRDGKTHTATGYLPHFGNKKGTLILSRFDVDKVDDAGDELGYYSSGLSPYSYEKYDKELIIATLNDWGWWGPEGQIPKWFKGKIRSHG